MDEVSRLIDFDDYELNNVIFQALAWIGSPAVTTPSYPDLTLGFFNQVPKQLSRFARTGVLLTIGCVPQSPSLLDSLSIWSCAMPERP